MELKREWFIRPMVKGCEHWSPFEEEVFRKWPTPIDRQATLDDVVVLINDAFATLIKEGGE